MSFQLRLTYAKSGPSVLSLTFHTQPRPPPLTTCPVHPASESCVSAAQLRQAPSPGCLLVLSPLSLSPSPPTQTSLQTKVRACKGQLNAFQRLLPETPGLPPRNRMCVALPASSPHLSHHPPSLYTMSTLLQRASAHVACISLSRPQGHPLTLSLQAPYTVPSGTKGSGDCSFFV